MPDATTARIRPMLKWPGGKYRLLDFILPALPAGRRLVEPFAGSAAVFLNSDYPAYLLADANADLIDFYRELVASGDGFIARCRLLFAADANAPEVFYRRRERFNLLPPGAERSALLLYLNRFGYNGLMRYNAKGGFNVPFGRYARPYFPEAEMRAFVAKARRTRVEFHHADFRSTFAMVRRGDAVYCDPPYIPLSATANFTSYTSGSFGPAEQVALAAAAEQALRRGAGVVISNHDAGEARRLYRGASYTRGTEVRRSISCNGGKRGKVRELLAVYS